MPARTFIDEQGTRWQVWDVVPGQNLDWPSASRRHLPEALADGWLCFEAEGQKRRVYPIPAGWVDWTNERLSEECGRAEPVVRRPRLAT